MFFISGTKSIPSLGHHMRSVAVLMCLLGANGCGSAQDGKLPVTGQVTWNGQPVELGYVELTPADGHGAVEGAEIHDGQFHLRISTGEKLVKVMAYRQIGMTKPDERISTPEPIQFQYLPTKFNEESDLKIAISQTAPDVKLKLDGKDLPLSR